MARGVVTEQDPKTGKEVAYGYFDVWVADDAGEVCVPKHIKEPRWYTLPFGGRIYADEERAVLGKLELGVTRTWTRRRIILRDGNPADFSEEALHALAVRAVAEERKESEDGRTTDDP